MEEIKVRDYVRTKDGYIGKYIKDGLVYKTIELEDNEMSWITGESNILKHSKYIIDLIEVGDYVNGHRILEKTKIKNNEMQVCILKDNNSSNWMTINNYTLKSIVTKETFANIEYRIGENNE